MSNPTSFYSVYIQFVFSFKLNWTARKVFTQGDSHIIRMAVLIKNIEKNLKRNEDAVLWACFPLDICNSEQWLPLLAAGNLSADKSLTH